MAIDRVRDQRLPSTGTFNINNLATATTPTPETWISSNNVTYTYTTEIVASSTPTGGTPTPLAETTDYNNATQTDSMLSYRNLLKVTVTVSKNGKQILKTVTYKTRNGYY